MSRRRTALTAAGLLAAGVAGAVALREVRRRAAAAPPAEYGEVELAGDLALPADVRRLDIETSDGGTLHVVERGEGPPIVLLHGVTLQAAVWAYQLRDLADRHRVIAVDLRGHGRSEPGRRGMTIAAMADDLADLLEALDLREATVVGHSMGGMTVLRFCRLHPELLGTRVAAVGIVASAAGITPSAASAQRGSLAVAHLLVAGHDALNEAGRPIFPGNRVGVSGARFVFGHHPDPDEVAATLAFGRAMRPERFVSLLPELFAFDERTLFGEVDLPVLVVVGDRDRLTPPRYARAVAASFLGARLSVLHGAGHMLMYERRRELDELLDDLSAAAVARGGAGTAR